MSSIEVLNFSGITRTTTFSKVAEDGCEYFCRIWSAKEIDAIKKARKFDMIRQLKW